MRPRTTDRFAIRVALEADIPALDALIERSVHGLMGETLAPEQMEVALGTVLGVDRTLVADGTYFVVEDAGAAVGAGGWSRRYQLYGVPTEEPRRLDPATEPARIRAFFVDPDYARQGVATLLLEHAEAAARAAGFSRIELLATPSGYPFYQARGYETVSEEPVVLANGYRWHGTVMRKSF